MCIIIYKPANTELPSTFADCWSNNSDGAGYCFPLENGEIQIRKGLMSFESFESSLKNLEQKRNLKKIPMLFHFRIETSGGINKAFTHPFPVSDKLEKLTSTKIRTDIAFVHNGIFSNFGNKNISDTAEFGQKILHPLFSLSNGRMDDNVKKIIENSIEDCRLAVMQGNKVDLFGKWHKFEDCFYSNLNYTKRTYAKYDYNNYYDYYNNKPTKTLYHIADYSNMTHGKYNEFIRHYVEEGEEVFVDIFKHMYIYSNGYYYRYADITINDGINFLNLPSFEVNFKDIYFI